jgi:hypothetical protein
MAAGNRAKVRKINARLLIVRKSYKVENVEWQGKAKSPSQLCCSQAPCFQRRYVEVEVIRG